LATFGYFLATFATFRLLCSQPVFGLDNSNIYFIVSIYGLATFGYFLATFGYFLATFATF